MTKAKAKAGKNRGKRVSGGRGPKKPVDLAVVRQQISDRVGTKAVDLVETTIAEADKGHYAAMKYLFELIGLYPASGQEVAPGEESLASTLLRRLGLPEDPIVEGQVTKGTSQDASVIGDAVK